MTDVRVCSAAAGQSAAVTFFLVLSFLQSPNETLLSFPFETVVELQSRISKMGHVNSSVRKW